jgi:hypothetical protein
MEKRGRKDCTFNILQSLFQKSCNFGVAISKTHTSMAFEIPTRHCCLRFSRQSVPRTENCKPEIYGDVEAECLRLNLLVSRPTKRNSILADFTNQECTSVQIRHQCCSS